MNDARLWVAVLAAVSFLSGATAGVLFAHGRFSAPPERGPFADYEALLTSHFELEPARRELLRDLLAHYQADLEQIRDRHAAERLAAMEPELRAKGREYALLLRDHLIPVARRQEFDRLAAENVVDL